MRERMKGSELTELVMAYVVQGIRTMPDGPDFDEYAQGKFREAKDLIEARDTRIIERVLLAVGGAMVMTFGEDEEIDRRTLAKIVRSIAELADDFSDLGAVDAFI